MNFKEEPLSDGEKIALNGGRAEDWTPRDVLVNILREIDQGLVDPDSLVVFVRDPKAEMKNRIRFWVSAPDRYTAIGTVHYGLDKFVRNSR